MFLLFTPECFRLCLCFCRTWLYEKLSTLYFTIIPWACIGYEMIHRQQTRLEQLISFKKTKNTFWSHFARKTRRQFKTSQVWMWVCLVCWPEITWLISRWLNALTCSTSFPGSLLLPVSLRTRLLSVKAVFNDKNNLCDRISTRQKKSSAVFPYSSQLRLLNAPKKERPLIFFLGDTSRLLHTHPSTHPPGYAHGPSRPLPDISWEWPSMLFKPSAPTTKW